MARPRRPTPGLRRASCWTPRRADRIDGVVRRGLPGRLRLEVRAWTPGFAAVEPAARTIQLAPFTAAVFRAELFERVGLLDERFESYLEDVDFGLRCAEAGLTALYVPEAVAYHQGSATLGRWHPDTVRKIARNQLLLVAKHYPPNWVLRYGWPVFIAQALWGFIALRHGALLSRVSRASWTVCACFARPGKACARLSCTSSNSSERELREIQELTGFDLYWRLYFALT